jgi:LuxR family maltose regulon positive regulatory protein
MSPPLLRTKLFVPPVRPGLVSRPRLVERLNEGLPQDDHAFGCKLTLISAPAGFGKTTLLSEWVQQSGIAVAWLSLDQEDNDPARFLTYVIAALRTIPDLSDAELGRSALADAESLQPQAIESVLTALINDVIQASTGGADRPLIFILDDYHVIESQVIDQTLSFLLDHMPPPPRGIHLVIAGRADPSLSLSRLRAAGHLTEIRVDDLRFRHEEAAAFLTQTMGLDLSPESVTALEIRTEGWIVGLQLAALSLQREHPDHIPRFIRTFTGSHRFVVDYLVEEVLRRRPPGTRSFLLQTSILDRLTGDLCDSVTGQNDGQTTLERLEETNLFLVPLDNERRWYRYHHLFAELLRNQLAADDPDVLPALHRSASKWFEAEGLLTEAITHSIAAEDWEQAARQILQTTVEMMARGENYTTLLRQLQALPDQVVRASPHLGIMYAYVLAIRLQLDAVEPRLREIEHVAGDQLPAELQLQIKDIRAHLAVHQNDAARAFAFSREVLGALPEDSADDNPLQRQARMGMVFNLGHSYLFFEGDVKEAERWYTETLALCQAANSTTLALRAMMGLAQTHQVGGSLHQAYETCRQGLELSKTTEQRYGRALPAKVWVQVVQGDLLREWNRLDEAADCLAQCIELCRLWQVGDILCMAYLFQARLQLAQGNLAGATDSIRQAERFSQAYRDVPWTGGPSSTCRARLALARARSISHAPTQDGVFDSAALRDIERCVKDSDLTIDGSVSSLNQEVAYLTWVRALIAGNRIPQALQLLDRLCQGAEEGGRTGRVIEMLVLKALALQTLGEQEKALMTLNQALVLAEPGGYIRVFVDEGIPMAGLLRRAPSRGVTSEYVGRLLAAFAAEARYPGLAAPPSPSPGALRESSPAVTEADWLPEPLSDRELEVLRLVATGLTNRAIALELSIAVSTVKTHMKNIHAKLGVRNRTQAVARARELGLLA